MTLKSTVGRTFLLACATGFMALVAGVATPRVMAAGDVNQTSCPAETEASPGFRTYLPDCRAYEMVSPPFKDGWRVSPEQFSLDGSWVVGSSFGSFAGGTSTEEFKGVQYQFSRGLSGWVTTPLSPPLPRLEEYKRGEFSSGPGVGTSGAALLAARLSTQSVFEGDLYLREPDGSFVLVGPMLPSAAVPPAPTGTGSVSEGELLQGASADLSHVLFSIEAGGQPAGITTNLWPGDTTTAGQSLYEYLGAGHTGTGSDVPTLTGVDNNGVQISQCGTSLAKKFNVAPGVSSAGATVLFTAAEGPCAEGGTGPAVTELFARIGDPGSTQATVNVAGTAGCTSSAGCDVTSPPVYRGASSDGSKVFFTTTQALSTSDHDSASDIYECDLPGDSGSTPTPTGVVNPCPALRPVSVTGTPSGASVLSVAAISDDGSHVYFVAEGVLASNMNGNGEVAAEGANNLYVYERDTTFPAGHTSFIGKLSSSGPAAQTTPDGRFLVFTDAAMLTPDDTSTAPQVFEYDAQTDQLARVSIGDQGFNNDGNTSVDAAELPRTRVANPGQSSHPSVSSDGSKVVFTSADGLTPLALNEAPINPFGEFAQNVYEYSGGRVYLISDGRAVSGNQRTALLGIDGSGRDVFFSIVDPLVSQDSDQLSDVYDARAEGGFPAPAGSAVCKGAECGGPLSGIPSLLPPGSATFSGPGNPPPPAMAPAVQVKRKAKQLSRPQKLSRALRACRRKPKRERPACVKRAHKRYGARSVSARHSHPSKRGNGRGR
jgi:hypothetical protein